MSSLPHASLADDAGFFPADEPGPSLTDEAWAANEFNRTHAEPATRTVPVNGQPVTLAGIVDDEARAYRAWHTPEGDFLAEHLERLGQLIQWTGAATPAEHEDRMAYWDEEIRAKEFDRGYAEGMEAARRELAIYLPR
jgi:hypothetical protein